MSKHPNLASTSTMLDLWRPPIDAGEPVGCMATTYTFEAGLFAEQCLGRFLNIESVPSREELAFALERWHLLCQTYVGVLVDHTHAGQPHSLQWDLLRVRIGGGKQHAKISLLAWTNHVRIIVTSANLTEAGYRYNYEVATALDVTPNNTPSDHVEGTCDFLRSLLAFVPGAQPEDLDILRARTFLNQVEKQVAQWAGRKQTNPLHQHLVFSLPGRDSKSALEGVANLCRKYGNLPSKIKVASPFFDDDADVDAATESLCKSMARGSGKQIIFCVPCVGRPDNGALRLAAPASLLNTAEECNVKVDFRVLPQIDNDVNPRPWHAKMIELESRTYLALVIGSSNFTRAGLGIVKKPRNAEANVLTIAVRQPHARESGLLASVWPSMIQVANPREAEWKSRRTEEEEGVGELLPAGFLKATFKVGDKPSISFRLDGMKLPVKWSIHETGQGAVLLDAEQWIRAHRKTAIEVAWSDLQPPEMLLVKWSEHDNKHEAPWSLNVDDPGRLPPPKDLKNMSTEDMLLLQAANDIRAAIRDLAKRHQREQMFDDDLDAAIPTGLDPLRRYRLEPTFLHRVRRRANLLANLRRNLERPVMSESALQWKLTGFIGVEPLARNILRDLANSSGRVDEGLLFLSDFLIVLAEVKYIPATGALTNAKFYRIYKAFLRRLIGELNKDVYLYRRQAAKQVFCFWERVVHRCLI